MRLFKQYQDLLDMTELQSALGVGRSTAYRLIRSGQIRHLRVGRKIKIPRWALMDFVESACYNEPSQNGQTYPVTERRTT